MDNENNALQRVIEPYEAKVNITYAGQNGDLGDPIAFDTPDAQVRAMITEAVRNGSVRGIPGDVTADFGNFVIDRFHATEDRNYNLIQIRPKTAFGAVVERHDAGIFKAPTNTNAVDPRNTFDTVKVFSATKAMERDRLGDMVTDWLRANPKMTIVDKIVTQSSDSEFHCLAITLFARRG